VGKEDLDCIDFQFQEDAQEAPYNCDPSDPFNLDPNADGSACPSPPLTRSTHIAGAADRRRRFKFFPLILDAWGSILQGWRRWVGGAPPAGSGLRETSN